MANRQWKYDWEWFIGYPTYGHNTGNWKHSTSSESCQYQTESGYRCRPPTKIEARPKGQWSYETMASSKRSRFFHPRQRRWKWWSTTVRVLKVQEKTSSSWASKGKTSRRVERWSSTAIGDSDSHHRWNKSFLVLFSTRPSIQNFRYDFAGLFTTVQSDERLCTNSIPSVQCSAPKDSWRSMCVVWWWQCLHANRRITCFPNHTWFATQWWYNLTTRSCFKWKSSTTLFHWRSSSNFRIAPAECTSFSDARWRRFVRQLW